KRMSHTFRREVQAVVDDIVLDIPGVRGGKAFGYPAYKINGRVFAFVGDGVALKLPKSQVKEMIAKGKPFGPFEANGIWQEWLHIELEEPTDYHEHTELFEESIGYVAEKG
ncbi:MAG: hypothetical protein H7175_28260, partial [Burkholderiales bacterium]|nr:hypothetical protein [Anaerolineae bacterium]